MSLVVFLIATCLSAGCVQGSDLTALYVRALSYDPTLQSANFSLKAARQARPEAFSALLPSVIATGSDSRTTGRTIYTGTPQVNRSFNADQWVLQLTQPLFRAENILAYGQARASVEQAVAQYTAAQADLILRLSRAYFDAVIAERHIGTAHAEVTALNEQLTAASRSFDAGVASITDVDDARSRTSLAQAQEEAALNDREAAFAALEAIVGTMPESLQGLRSKAVLPRPEPLDVALWVSRALTDNPTVRAASAAVNVADYDVDRSYAARLPTLDLVATYGGNYSSGNITEPTNFGSNVKDRQVSVQVSVPLLEGGALQAHVTESRARKSKAQADYVAAQREAALSARQSYAAVLSGIAQVHALEIAVASGRSAVKGNRVGYGLGIRINSDVLNAEQQLYSAMQDLDKARYDTLFAGLKLKAATGELSGDDLKAINALFDTLAPADTPTLSSTGTTP